MPPLLGGAGGVAERQREKTLKLNGETLAVDSRNPWEYTYDRDGRLIKRATEGTREASRGPRLLVVEVLAARDIESSDYGGTSDPYCLLELSGVRRRTAGLHSGCMHFPLSLRKRLVSTLEPIK